MLVLVMTEENGRAELHWRPGIPAATFPGEKKKKISLELVVASSLTLPVYLFMK